MKRKLSIALIILLVISLFSGMGNYDISAKAKKVKLSTKKVTVYKGKTKTIKLKNATKKVKWKVKNKKVAKMVKKSGKKKNTVKVKGLKKGSTKIIATHGKKKFTAKIVVKQKANTTVGVERETTSNVVETTKQETTTEAVEETTAIQNPHENKNVVASLENDKITVDDSLVINFTLQDYKEGQSMIWAIAPVKFEKYVDGEWVSVNWIQGIPEPMYESVGDKGRLKVPLSRYFEITEGHYRWIHEVNWTEVTVEFDIIAETEDEDIFVGSVINNNISVEDMLVIEYSAIGFDTSDIITYNSLPETLEIFEDGEWVEMKYKEDVTLSYVESATLANNKLPLVFTPSKYYQNVREGHYRYTHKIGDEDVSVEFEIAQSEPALEESLRMVAGDEPALIIAEIASDTLVLGENLVIKTIITGKGDWEFTELNSMPGKLEIYEDEAWNQMEVNNDNVDFSDVGKMMMGSCFYEETIELDSLYLNIRSGHYRYTYEIGGYDFVFEFDVV